MAWNRRKLTLYPQDYETMEMLQSDINNILAINQDEYYILCNGKIVKINEDILAQCVIHVVPRIIGGKGGFGSMLRAIGAQIEKTTNREACRDLSGRRLRDINEEKRLKTWIAQQVEREKEAENRKQKKLERLCKAPKHEFKNELYEQERLKLTENVEDAFEQGVKSTSTITIGKRKRHNNSKESKKKCVWIASDEELSSSNAESDEDFNAKYLSQSNSGLALIGKTEIKIANSSDEPALLM